MTSPNRRPINGIRIAIAIAFIAVATTIWVLNVTDGPWSSIFVAILVSTGVVIALIQFYPRPAIVPIDALPQNLQQLDTLDENFFISSPTGQEGQLHVYTTKSLRGSTVDLCRGFGDPRITDMAENIVERKIRGHTHYIAIFQAVLPGGYTAHIYRRERMARVTIRAGQVTVIDWR